MNSCAKFNQKTILSNEISSFLEKIIYRFYLCDRKSVKSLTGWIVMITKWCNCARRSRAFDLDLCLCAICTMILTQGNKISTFSPFWHLSLIESPPPSKVWTFSFDCLFFLKLIRFLSHPFIILASYTHINLHSSLFCINCFSFHLFSTLFVYSLFRFMYILELQ